MTTEHDPRTRIVLSWLREDAHENAERVLLSALDAVDATPQRRSRWPAWRTFDMHPAFKFGFAAAAVLIVAIVGYNLLPQSTLPPGAGQTVAPTATPTARPVQTPPIMPPGSLNPGTYTMVSDSNTPLSVTVPRGWTSDGTALTIGDPFRGNGVGFAPWIITHVYLDACKWRGTSREVPSADGLFSFLSNQKPGRPVATNDTLVGASPGAYPADVVAFRLDADADVSSCDGGLMRLWPDTGGGEDGGLPLLPGQSVTVYIIETNGGTTALVAISNEDSDPNDLAQLSEIVRSIRILN